MEAEERQGQTTYRTIGFRSGTQLGGRIADPNTAPEHPMDVPIVVPTLLIDMMFPCCPGCETLNEPVTELVPIEEDHPVTLPRNNQG